MKNVEDLHSTNIAKLKEFFKEKAATSQLHKAIVALDKYSAISYSTDQKQRNNNELKDQWIAKPLHGRYPSQLEKSCVEISTEWLKKGHLYGETEGFMVAIQDNVISTRNHLKYIVGLKLDDEMCRMCNKHTETIEHLIAGCTVLAPSEYLKRHNLTANIVHQELAYQYKLVKEKTQYFKYIPFPVLENDAYRLYWDTTIRTDKPVSNNRPDITLVDKNNNTAFFIDIAHPSDHNLEKSEKEKINKYFDLTEEYRKIYDLKSVLTIPLVISATGLATKNLRKGLELLNLKEKGIIVTMQKAVILETCRIVRRVLNIPENKIN